MAKLAKGVDVLVMDSGGIVCEGEGPRSERKGGRRSRRPCAHGSLEDVAKMAAAANARKVVLVHFRSGTVDETETGRRISAIYAGEVVFAKDLQTHR